MQRTVTVQHVLCVVCPTCGAKETKVCDDLIPIIGKPLSSFHDTRIFTAIERHQSLNLPPLDPTDKALVCYYMAVAMAASISTKSQEIMGKETSYKAVIEFFAKQAIDELMADGLLSYQGRIN